MSSLDVNLAESANGDKWKMSSFNDIATMSSNDDIPPSPRSARLGNV